MMHHGLRWLAAVLMAAVLAACASTPRYDKEDCPTWDDLEAIEVNPAGAMDRLLRVQAAFRVCPPVEGLAEIERKRIELRHEMIALISAKSEAELENPLRTETLRGQLLVLVNEKVLKRSTVTEVFITELHLK